MGDLSAASLLAPGTTTNAAQHSCSRPPHIPSRHCERANPRCPFRINYIWLYRLRLCARINEQKLPTILRVSDVDGVGAYMDLDEVMFWLVDLNPPPAVLVSGGPALNHLERHLFLGHHHTDRDTHRSISTLCTNAQLKRSTTRTTPQSRLHRPCRCSRWPSPHTAMDSGGSGQLFMGEIFSFLVYFSIVGMVLCCMVCCETFCGPSIVLPGRDFISRADTEIAQPSFPYRALRNRAGVPSACLSSFVQHALLCVLHFSTCRAR
ncbi:hypothetical protein B0H12DRAFT_599582 [Mycena haematopus]|nr:hypothetical protein B0H12DRAFT_599582 [Mycena haematopus]